MIRIKNKLFFILAFSMALVVTLSNYLVQFPVSYIGLEELLTYGAFSYPVAFLITDLSNRKYGKNIEKKIVYLGFILGVFATLYFFSLLGLFMGIIGDFMYSIIDPRIDFESRQ